LNYPRVGSLSIFVSHGPLRAFGSVVVNEYFWATLSNQLNATSPAEFEFEVHRMALMPLTSIIITTLNRSQLSSRAVESAFWYWHNVDVGVVEFSRKTVRADDCKEFDDVAYVRTPINLDSPMRRMPVCLLASASGSVLCPMMIGYLTRSIVINWTQATPSLQQGTFDATPIVYAKVRQ
jgi:hypothetical protein